MASLIGKEIGKYRITERIGRGGMAEVYLGIHTLLDRKVAIKVLHSHLLEGGDFVARFKREAKAVANLRHPNIVQVHDFDIQDELIFMVMEYIDGTNLHTRLVEVGNKGERLPIKLIGSIINDIAGALDYAHSKAMLHRDIKPSNILLDKDDKAYLTDFGIAKLLDDQKFTATGQLVGTPAYMSPEQGMGEDLSEESDIYSLGIVAFEMLTGQVPYDAKTPIGIVHKQINAPIPNMSELVDGVPKTAQAVLDRALAKSPEGRYSSAEALVGALKVALQALESTEPLETELPAEEKAAADEVLDAPTITMQDPELDQATVVMEKVKKKKKSEEKPPVDKKPAAEPVKKTAPKKDKAKKKIPLWAYIAGGMVVVAGIAVILTQVLDTGLPGGESASADPNIVEVVYNADGTSNGLEISNEGDANYERVDVGDVRAVRSGNGKVLTSGGIDRNADSYLQFNIADDIIFELPEGSDITILVEYFDQGTDQFYIQYDAHFGGDLGDGRFKVTGVLTKTDTDEFRIAQFNIPDAFFGNRQNDGTDFRIFDNNDGAEVVSSVTVIYVPSEGGEGPNDQGSSAGSSGEELFLQAQQYYDDGLIDQALESSFQAMDAGYETFEVYNLLGRSFRRLGMFPEAIEQLDRAIELNPDYYWSYYNRGTSKYQLGDFEGAIEDLVRATELDPDTFAAWFSLGETYFYSGREEYYHDAILAFDQAIGIDPEDPLSRMLRGELNWKLFNDAEGAQEDFNIAVENADPNDPRPYNVRGLFYFQTGQFELCIEDYSEFIAREPKNPWAWLERGDCYRDLGQDDPARHDYERFLELSEGNGEFEKLRQDVQTWLDEH